MNMNRILTQPIEPLIEFLFVFSLFSSVIITELLRRAKIIKESYLVGNKYLKSSKKGSPLAVSKEAPEWWTSSF